MKKILDYEEMVDLLNSLDKKVIKEEKPIGYTSFNFPIRHYSYGHGNNHVIITGGTHSAELISNIFVIRFMEKLSNKEISIDKDIYTLDFIPFVNPEGTEIVTKTIRTLMPRDMNEEEVQTYCLTYYRNSYIEGKYATEFNDKGVKLQQEMFRYATPDIIENEGLRNSLKKIIEINHLPKGCMINWSSNGRGVDLNSNIKFSEFIDRVQSDEKVYAPLHLNTIRRDLLGPVGCPFYNSKGEIEAENKALLNFYEDIKNKYNLIGSFIYHSCGDIVYYLGQTTSDNPWIDFTKEMEEKNYQIALKYAGLCGYKAYGREAYTTMDSKIKSLYPVTLLIELGGVRATPLSQFMDLNLSGSNEKFKNVYTKIIKENTKALLETIPLMLQIK